MSSSQYVLLKRLFVKKIRRGNDLGKGILERVRKEERRKKEKRIQEEDGANP